MPPEPSADELDAKFRSGLALHQAGRISEAERIYLDILRAEQKHFDATYLLGVIALQTHRIERGIEFFNWAVALRPDHVEAHNNRGAALASIGRFADALSDYDIAIKLNPDHAGAHNNRGAALATLNRPADALNSYDRAIALRPGSAELHTNRAAALAVLGLPEDAKCSCDTAIELKPDYAPAHYNRGNALRDLGHLEDAVTAYDQAIALNPDFAEAHNNRGGVLADLGRLADALASNDRVVALKPNSAEAHNNRGAALADLGRFEDALVSYDRAIALRPNYAEAFKNRGAALSGLGRLDEALTSCDRAIALQPDYAEAYANRAAALTNLGRTEEALSYCEQALALKPDLVEARYNEGVCHLTVGDLERGWEGYQWRWRSRLAPRTRALSGEPWLGDFTIDGKTILVRAEQGFGDTIQFCRYVPMLAASANVVLDVPRALVRLMDGLDGVSRVVANDDPPPPFDAWVPVMSLPLAFRTNLETIPASIPYLHAEAEKSAGWRRRLAALPGLKAGLVWAGSPFAGQPRARAMDGRRSFSLQRYAPLARLPGVSLISLQKGEPAQQTRTPPDGMALQDWTGELNDYADTAALVEALDLVISVDTSVVHLAGALGKPVWVLNRYDQCWRWLRDRTDSPWYPTARLFRQRTPGDWDGVIREVAGALEDLTGGR